MQDKVSQVKGRKWFDCDCCTFTFAAVGLAVVYFNKVM